MADGKQQQASTPSENVRSNPKLDAKRAELMKRAEERIGKIDVGWDGMKDTRELETKKKALEFISTECLSLPEDRFFKLLDAVELRMKQREAYKQNMLEEFRKARAEIMGELSSAKPAETRKTPDGHNGTISGSGVEYDPKKLSSYDNEIIGDNFNPHRTDVGRAIWMMVWLNREPVLSGQFLMKVDSKPETIAGLAMHWNEKHPVRIEMVRRGLNEALKLMDETAQEYRDKYSYADFLRMPAAKVEKHFAERVKAWKTQNGYNKKWNAVMDGLNLDRNLFENGFSVNSETMGVWEYTEYVQRAANYLEYAADNNGKAEFIRQATRHPESAAEFILDWNYRNRIYKILQLRWERNTIDWVDGMKNEIMKYYGIGIKDLAKNKKELAQMIEKNPAKDVKYLRTSRESLVKSGFDATITADVGANAVRYLNLASLDVQADEWKKFADELSWNKESLAKFLAHWPKCGLRDALTRDMQHMNPAIQKLNSLHSTLLARYGIPKSEKNPAEVLKLIQKNSEKAKERQALSLEVEEKYPAYRKKLEKGFEKIKKAMTENKLDKLREAQNELSELSSKDLLALQLKTRELFNDDKTNPEWQKVTSLRVAIEALCSINVTDYDNEFLNWAKSQIWGHTGTEISAKTWQLQKILDEYDFGAVIGFEKNSSTGTPHKRLSGGQMDEAVKDRRIEDVNSEAFAQSLCLAYVSGTIGPEYLKNRWWEYRLMQIALHWGIDDQGNDSGYNSSRAYKKLEGSNRISVAKEFKSSLQVIMASKAKEMERLNQINADKKALVEFLGNLKKPKPAPEECESFVKKMTDEKSSAKRWDMLKQFKGSELSVADLKGFYEALAKLTDSEAKHAREWVKKHPAHDRNLSTHPDFTRIMEATAGFNQSKKPEELAVFEFLRNPKLYAVSPMEDKKDGGRARKLRELDSEQIDKLLEIASKYLPKDSELLSYLRSRSESRKHTQTSREYGLIAANPEANHAALTQADRTDDPEKRRKLRDSQDKINSNLWAAEASVIEAREYGKPGAKLTAKEEKALSEVREAAKQLREETGISLVFAQDSELAKSFWIDSKTSLEAWLGKISEKNAAQRQKYESDRSGNEVSQSSGPSTTMERYPATKFVKDAEIGESIRVTESVTATKTGSGWLELRTPNGKIVFGASEAKGAAETMEMLKSAEMPFLIPAMKEIASISGISFKSWIGREEARRMLSSLSLALWFDNIADEVDPAVLLRKLRAAGDGAFWWDSLYGRMRKYGITDENWALSRDGLKRRMSASSRIREAGLVEA